MLKPVSILTLDAPSAALAEAVQRRIAATSGLEDLVQARQIATDGELAPTIESIHARRQSPNSPLRVREDIANRELVLLVLSAAGPAPARVIEIARAVQQLYDMRGLAQFYSVEVLCLLPDLFVASTAADYGTAYSLLRNASAAMEQEPKPFETMWLLASTNGSRVKFGPLDQTDAYAEVIAGVLMFEPELSGTLAGAFRPRGMDATFSSFGFAELQFPRETAAVRLESRLAAELIRDRLLAPRSPAAGGMAQLAAKQFVLAEQFAGPLSRIGADAGRSLFRRFQAKNVVSEKTRDAEELIAGVRAELKAHRESAHVEHLRGMAVQEEEIAGDFATQVGQTVEAMLDREDYAAALRFSEALLDPLPDLRTESGVAPRNLITEIHSATAALDERLQFTPNVVTSEAMRKRIRELDTLVGEQQLVADTLAPLDAGDVTKTRAAELARQREETLAAMTREQRELTLRLPDVLFAEEAENNAARNAARDAEAARLAEESAAREMQLRELFVELPIAERTLRELLEERLAFIRRQVAWGVVYTAAVYGVPFLLGRLMPLPFFAVWYAWLLANLGRVTSAVVLTVIVFVIYSVVRYFGDIGSRLSAARERLSLLRDQIDATDKAKNAAYNDELQFEYDVTQRRTALAVLRRTRDAAKQTFDRLRSRSGELLSLADSYEARARTASIPAAAGVSVPILKDAEVDAWYAATAADRKLLFLEFPELCMTRSQSLRMPLHELQSRVDAYAARGFADFRQWTLAQIVSGSRVIANPASVEKRLRRLAESSAALIEVRDDDVPAERAMQRDTTLWIDANDASFVQLIRRRLPDAHLKPPTDPLRVHAMSRVLHYPAYVLSQLEYYRAQYDPSQHPESAAVPDLLPSELVLTGALRTAYEQILLGRAVGLLQVRKDGRVGRAGSRGIFGESHLAAAQHLVASSSDRHDLERELTPRLSIASDVERGLHAMLEGEPELSEFDRDVVKALLRRYGP